MGPASTFPQGAVMRSKSHWGGLDRLGDLHQGLPEILVIPPLTRYSGFLPKDGLLHFHSLVRGSNNSSSSRVPLIVVTASDRGHCYKGVAIEILTTDKHLIPIPKFT